MPNHCEHLLAFSLLGYVPHVQLSFLHCFYLVFTLKLRTVFLIVIGTYLFSVQIVGHSILHNQGPLEISTEHSKLIMHGAESLTDGIFEIGAYGIPSKSQNPTVLGQGGPSST